MGRDSAYYFEVLYPLQDAILSRIAPLRTGFYLTGGTAASRGYLGHLHHLGESLIHGS